MAEYHGFLAEIHWKAGRLDEALAEVDEALSIADRTNSRCYEAELHRIKGEVLLARSPEDEADGRGLLPGIDRGGPSPGRPLLGVASGHEPG